LFVRALRTTNPLMSTAHSMKLITRRQCKSHTTQRENEEEKKMWEKKKANEIGIEVLIVYTMRNNNYVYLLLRWCEIENLRRLTSIALSLGTDKRYVICQWFDLSAYCFFSCVLTRTLRECKFFVQWCFPLNHFRNPSKSNETVKNTDPLPRFIHFEIIRGTGKHCLKVISGLDAIRTNFVSHSGT